MTNPQQESILSLVKSWEPLSDRVIVVPDEKGRQTTHGIYMAETKSGDSRRQSGVVLAAGRGRVSDQGELIPMEVWVGDRVLFKKYAGDDLLVNADGATEGYVGDPPREDQVLVTFCRQESILSILPSPNGSPEVPVR